jgi:hypothetical protein
VLVLAAVVTAQEVPAPIPPNQAVGRAAEPDPAPVPVAVEKRAADNGMFMRDFMDLVKRVRSHSAWTFLFTHCSARHVRPRNASATVFLGSCVETPRSMLTAPRMMCSNATRMATLATLVIGIVALSVANSSVRSLADSAKWKYILGSSQRYTK